MRLAIIIPALEEERSLGRILPAVTGLGDELVVSDGGSTDGTVATARRLGVRVVEGTPGRGPQLNRGAAASAAEILLFLHADSLPPAGAAEAIRRAVAAGAEGGGFQVHFEGEGGGVRLGSRLVNLRTRLTRLPLGDQGQFVSRAVFEELGGYRDWPILEDLDFARRLRRRGKLVILPLAMRTSFRRYQKRGVVRTVVVNWLIWLLFALGVSPHRLARLYRVVR
ncbi:MAG: TIGR04283 family arsenosugar biosynthesis glycosyltransferase [Thermoanaerobaculia bacterium]